MKISLLAAADEGNVIGNNNQLPWYLPSDMKYFKNLTWGMPVVMGRKTFEAMQGELKGRISIVVSNNASFNPSDVTVVNTIPEAIKKAVLFGANEIFIIGGAQIYKAAIDMADRIYLTRIHAKFQGDAFFPEIDKNSWNLERQKTCQPDANNKYAHSFQVWERKRQNPA